MELTRDQQDHGKTAAQVQMKDQAFKSCREPLDTSRDQLKHF